MPAEEGVGTVDLPTGTSTDVLAEVLAEFVDGV